MKDLIDQRNFKEKCARSIVKGYNVHYLTQEEIEEQQRLKAQEAKAQLQVQTMIKEPAEVDERWADKPSASYGQAEEKDPVTREQIEKILGERKEELSGTIEEQLSEVTYDEETED